MFAVFLGIVAYLVASSFVRRSLPTYEPSAIGPRPPGVDTVVSDTVTVDARDPTAWRFFDLDRGSVVSAPDTAGWDLAFRRFHIIASGGIVDLGKVAFDSVVSPPRGGFAANLTASDTLNPATADWYHYNFLSHLLESKDHLYVTRTADHRYAKFTILSYYCPGLAGGCFTLRYTYPLASIDER